MDWPRNEKIVLDLSPDLDSLWAGLTGMARRAIRKSEGHRMATNDIRFWPLLYCGMIDKGIRLDMRNVLDRGGASYIELDGNRIVGGALIVGTHYDIGIGLTQWLLWEIVKTCKDNGISTLDLGWSRIGGGSHFFKTHFFKTYKSEVRRASLRGMAKGWVSKRITWREYRVYRYDSAS